MAKKTSTKSDSFLSTSQVKQIKPILIKVLLASVGVAGLVGIFALLYGQFGNIHADIIGTVILTAALSVGLLIYLSIDNSRYHVVGLMGIITSFVAFALGLILIWSNWSLFDDGNDDAWRAYVLTLVMSVALAHISLLVRLLDHRVAAIRMGILGTILSSVVLVVLFWSLLYARGFELQDTIPRMIGVFGILAASGTIILPVWARLQKK